MTDNPLRMFLSPHHVSKESDALRDAAFRLALGSLSIAMLERHSGVWRFWYTDEFKSQQRIVPLVPFPDRDQIYESSELWPFFAVRVPSIARPEIQNTVTSEGLDYDDLPAMLARFGRRTVADPFTLEMVEQTSSAGTS